MFQNQIDTLKGKTFINMYDKGRTERDLLHDSPNSTKLINII